MAGMVELLVQATGWDCLQVVVGCFCCWQRWEGWQLQRLGLPFLKKKLGYGWGGGSFWLQNCGVVVVVGGIEVDLNCG